MSICSIVYLFYSAAYHFLFFPVVQVPNRCAQYWQLSHFVEKALSQLFRPTTDFPANSVTRHLKINIISRFQFYPLPHSHLRGFIHVRSNRMDRPDANNPKNCREHTWHGQVPLSYWMGLRKRWRKHVNNWLNLKEEVHVNFGRIQTAESERQGTTGCECVMAINPNIEACIWFERLKPLLLFLFS